MAVALGVNGGILGPANTPSLSSASGLWTWAEQYRAQRGGTWPPFAVVDPYFDYVTLLLHGNGTNGAQNNTFLDSSTNNFTITRNGNTTQGTFTPYGENWSNYFDGSGDYLSSPNNAAIHVLGSDFCLEGWFYLTAAQGDNGLYSTYATSAGNDSGYVVRLTSTTIRVVFGPGTGAATVIDRTYSFTTGQWYHFAVTNSGSTGRIFVNGVQQGATFSTSGFANSTADLWIGRTHTTTWDFPGHLSNFRVVKGSAVYTSAFTPSTAPLTAITNTSLLTCQANRFRDASTNNFTITRNGDVSVQRFSPFNPPAAYSAATIGGSGYFDGSGDYLVCGAAADWTFMSNTTALWSVEMWVYPTVGGTDTTYFDTAGSTTANVGFLVQKTSGNLVNVQIYYGSAGNFIVNGSSTTALQINAWNHVLITYDQSQASQNLKFYINGGSAETANKTGNTPSSSNPNRALTVATYGAGGGNFFTGYIGSVRVSNVIRSSGIPTTPYTSDANTRLLLNFTNGGIIDNAMMNDLETVGNAQISTSVSKFGGGSIAFNGTNSNLSLPSGPPLYLSTGDFTIEMFLYTTTATTVQQVFIRRSSATARGMVMNISGVTSQKITFLAGDTNTAAWEVSLTGATSLANNTWYHVAVTRSGNTFTLWVNGVSDATASSTVTIADDTSTLLIGVSDGASNYLNGNIDEFRITKGYARYTATFTPPTAPFPDQ